MGILQFKKVNCKNCYQCVRNCPVKSIEVKNHQAQIIERECILCGRCTVVCPQKAKTEVCELPRVRELLLGGARLVASVAPSYAAFFSLSGFAPLREALLQLGFADARETAEGAYLVKSEYERLAARDARPIVTSACTAVNAYVEKHYPEALPYLAPVLTPMQAHARLIKRGDPGVVVIFIGPCISKKAECLAPDSYTDVALTFENLRDWLGESRIALHDACEPHEPRRSRFFPTDGGILATMERLPGRRYVSASGMEECMAALRDVVAGRLPGCVLELSACRGSCVGGPSFADEGLSRLASQCAVEATARADDGRDFDLPRETPVEAAYHDRKIEYAMPTEKQILTILQRMGKHGVEDEINCGICGYASCREKAVAIYFGKAEQTMCLPYMQSRAESLSGKILEVTPNAVLAVDDTLKILQVNAAACELFGLRDTDLVGQPVSRVLDEFDFVEMLSARKPRAARNVFLAEYNVYLEQNLLYDAPGGVIVCIMKDITREKQRRGQLRKRRLQTAGMADAIVEKQLRIVHEIASLLGETAAETKAAVRDLKETILLEEEE